MSIARSAKHQQYRAIAKSTISLHAKSARILKFPKPKTPNHAFNRTRRYAALLLAFVCGGGPVNLVLLGPAFRAPLSESCASAASANDRVLPVPSRVRVQHQHASVFRLFFGHGRIARRFVPSHHLRARAFVSLVSARACPLRSSASRLARRRRPSLSETRLRCHTLTMQTQSPPPWFC